MAFNADEYIDVIVGQLAGNFQELSHNLEEKTKLQDTKKELQNSKDTTESAKLSEELKQLEESYRNIEPLTVGLFGEWGSGKTHLLKLIESKVNDIQVEQKSLKTEEKTFPQITIPVFFNAWRFEKEEHLIIPLFQTMLTQLEEYEHKTFLEEGKTFLSHTLIKLNVLGKALKKGFKVPNISEVSKKIKELNPSVIADLLNVDAISEEYAKQIKEKLVDDDLFKELTEESRLESVYYKIPEWIEKITTTDKINFIFLIDDLDRCLPENTLKMLESIKLFLDVPSCAFVLAIDDDVVERGVIHHYRDYLKEKESSTHELPITGHEYLEKMVQLPFRIPVIDVANVRLFLEKNYADSLFKPLDKEESHKVSEELLTFFSKTIPAKPRKIKRTAMLFDTKLKIYQKLKEKEKLSLPLNHMLLAKITLLELFAPKLLRFIQNNGYQRVYNRLGHFRGVEKKEEKAISLLDKETIKNHIENAYDPKEQEMFTRLMSVVYEGSSARMSFDLDVIFDKIEDPEDLKVNIELKESAIKSNDKPKEEVTVLSDTFWEKIFRENDETSWHDAFNDNELFEEGKALLSKEAVKELSAKAKGKTGFADNAKWFLVLADYMKQEQLIELLNEIYPYKMNPYQTTFEEYDKYCEATGAEKPNDNGWGRGKRPVINVSWEDAIAYAKWLSGDDENKYRLPTEDEWYLACNVGAKTKWHFGDDESKLKNYAWYRANSFDMGQGHKDYGTHEVGSKGKESANELGLYDMHGNVWEWCEDWYNDNKEEKVLRGGSWNNDDDYTRSAYRLRYVPADRGNFVGFRILRTLP